MSAPVVTDSMREFAEAYVFACRDACAAWGVPFDARLAEWRIREALLNPRWNPADDCDPDTEDMPNVPGYLQGRDL